MTLTVCLQGKDVMVVAADSRGTFGDPRGITAQNDTIKKVYMIGNSGISVAGAQNSNLILEEVAKLASKENNVTDIMVKIRETAINKYNQWFQQFPYMPMRGYHPAFVRPQIEISIAGYDKLEYPTPRMYSMNSSYNFAPNLHDYGFVLFY